MRAHRDRSLFPRYHPLSALFTHPQGIGPGLADDALRRSGGFLPFVAMMKTTDPRQSDDLGCDIRNQVGRYSLG